MNLSSIIQKFEHIHPNTITIASFCFSVLFAISMYYHNFTLAVIVYAGLSLDALDGTIARKFNKTTPFGAFLDSTLDRLSDGLVIASFGFAKLISWELVVALLITSFLVSYARARCELASGGKLKCNVGIIERTQRLVLIFVALLLYLILPEGFKYITLNTVFVILLILSIVTVIQRMYFAYKNL